MGDDQLVYLAREWDAPTAAVVSRAGTLVVLSGSGEELGIASSLLEALDRFPILTTVGDDGDLCIDCPEALESEVCRLIRDRSGDEIDVSNLFDESPIAALNGHPLCACQSASGEVFVYRSDDREVIAQVTSCFLANCDEMSDWLERRGMTFWQFVPTGTDGGEFYGWPVDPSEPKRDVAIDFILNRSNLGSYVIRGDANCANWVDIESVYLSPDDLADFAERACPGVEPGGVVKVNDAWYVRDADAHLVRDALPSERHLERWYEEHPGQR